MLLRTKEQQATSRCKKLRDWPNVHITAIANLALLAYHARGCQTGDGLSIRTALWFAVGLAQIRTKTENRLENSICQDSSTILNRTDEGAWKLAVPKGLVVHFLWY